MSAITVDRKLLQRALKCAEDTGYPLALIADLRAALAQQAEPVEPVAWSGYDLDGMVEALSRVVEAHYQRANPFQNPIDMDAQMALRVLRGFIPAMKAYTAPPQRKQAEPAQEPITRLFGTLPVHDTQQALAQQAEPDHETRAELAEQQVVQLAEERDHYRNLWQKAQQAEPVQEPVEPFGYWFSDKHQDAVCSGWFVRSPCDGKLDGKPGVPLYTAPPRCPNCGSLEAQNTELDNMLVAMEHAVAQAAAVERKACADICDAHASCEGIAQQCAAAIRARGQA